MPSILHDEYEWDPVKARANRRKHGIAFADAATVFSDERAICIVDETWSERRFVHLGTDLMGRVLVVVWTPRGERIRLISARRATARERAEYEW